ncbi:hypothetical protein EZS27_023512 [termite gut metagenome]|uniref:Uncharacterized protein n=1 Tax=termite gut metagenome TaxID=433724 RepID=A0A5J4R1B1_9ZZZZ
MQIAYTHKEKGLTISCKFLIFKLVLMDLNP